MLRKLVCLLAVVGMGFSIATSASAALLAPLQSEMFYKLGTVPAVRDVYATYRFGGWATLNATQDTLTVQASLWATVAAGSGGTSIYTGTALITNLVLTAANLSGTFTASFTDPNPMGGNLTGTSATPSSNTICPGGCLGGYQGVTGQNLLGILGTPIPFPNNVIGGPGISASIPTLGIVASGGPFVTGKIRITNITSNVLSMPGRGGVTGIAFTLVNDPTEEVKTFTSGGYFVTTYPTAPLMVEATVSVTGSMNVTAGGAGTVTMVAPARVLTGALGVGNLPVRLMETFVFVPEPGTMLLLLSGAAGLVLLGRKRMLK